MPAAPEDHFPAVAGRDLADPAAWDRSRNASRTRRGAALRARRFARSRRAGVAVVFSLALASSGAVAATHHHHHASSRSTASDAAPSKSVIKAAQTKLHLKADGMVGPHTRSRLRSYQHAHHLKVTGQLDDATLTEMGLQSSAASAPRNATAMLAAIAQCESGDDPTAVSKDGRYHGKYQFSKSTWRSVGGSGDPADAPEAEQDARAAALYKQHGLHPWPVCGPKAAAGEVTPGDDTPPVAGLAGGAASSSSSSSTSTTPAPAAAGGGAVAG